MDTFFGYGFYWFWFGLATVLLAIEAYHGRFVFMPISFAALLMGVMTHFYPFAGVGIQLVFFVLLSGSLSWLTRNYLAQRNTKIRRLQEVVQKRSYIGKVLVLVNPIEQGRATIDIDGAVWNLRGPDAPSGTRMRVVDMGEGWLQLEREA